MNKLVILAIVFAVIRQFIGAAKRARDAAAADGGVGNRPAGTSREVRSDASSVAVGKTQGKALGLEEVLREIERIKAGAPGAGASLRQVVAQAKASNRNVVTVRRPSAASTAPVTLPESAGVVGRRSSGSSRFPDAQSPAPVDQDDIGEQVAERRKREAEARDYALAAEDHSAFDQLVRTESADNTAVKGPTNQQLRDAIVWREILGPPVGLREGEEG
ncbi:MAG: hypothetical protein ABJD11_15265 [Gemmatimonadota bacterium]